MSAHTVSILSTNFIALLLSLTMAIDGVWKKRRGDMEQGLLNRLFFLSSATCVLDPVTWIVNGRQGSLFHVLNLLSNSILFLTGVAGIWSWTLLMQSRLFGKIDRRFALIARVLFVICAGMIVLNLFYPAVFFIDGKNFYHRRWGLFFIAGIEILYFFYSIVRYVIAKRHGGLLKFFPVVNFMIPVFAGIILQFSFYGTSLIPACCVIATVSVAISRQNEAIYRDKLTGLYNRAYLDYITDRLTKEGAAPVTGVMLDVNGFKGINDTYGHQTGDEALVSVSRILEQAVQEYGTVIRYAGDEFILLINSTDNTISSSCFDRMKAACDAFNAASTTYEISLSYGYEIFYPEDEHLDEFMNRIDAKMYADKQRYYETTGKERRKS